MNYNLPSSRRNFKTSLLAVLCPLSGILALDSAAQLPTNNLAPAAVAVQTDTNGVLLAPTNFFHANKTALNAEVTGGGGSQTPLLQTINAAGFSITNQGTNISTNFYGTNFVGGSFSGNQATFQSNVTLQGSADLTVAHNAANTDVIVEDASGKYYPTNAPAVSATNMTNLPAPSLGGVLPALDAGSLQNIPFKSDASSSIFSQWGYAGTVISYNQSAFDTLNLRCSASIKRNGTNYMFYSVNTANTSANKGFIAYSYGPDLYHQTFGGLALTNSTTGWDTNHVQSPRFYTENGIDYMFYVGGTNTGFEGRPNSLGVATQKVSKAWSPTGFAKVTSVNPLLSPTNTYNVNSVWRGDLIKNGSTYYLFQNGGDAGLNESICVALATNILGPYTQYAGNPIIPAPLTGGGEALAQDPSVIRLNDGNFAMAYSKCCNVETTINLAWSADLTNWTSVTNIPIANYSGGEIQSYDFFYDDNQLCVSFDDTFSIYLARPINQVSANRFQTITTNLQAGTIQAGVVGAQHDVVDIRANAVGAAIAIQNNNVSGWSAIDCFDNTGTQQGGFGYGNASTGNFNSTMYLFSQGKNIDIVNSGGGAGAGIFINGSTGDAQATVSLSTPTITVTNAPTLILTNSAPGNTTTAKRWFPITNNGAIFLLPGYQ